MGCDLKKPSLLPAWQTESRRQRCGSHIGIGSRAAAATDLCLQLLSRPLAAGNRGLELLPPGVYQKPLEPSTSWACAGPGRAQWCGCPP